jgi:beta-fructofuranosidase
MPPTGWLNDPNAVCQIGGTYHLYYQYSPYDPKGDLKYWGHYTSSDLVHFEDHGLALLPDQPYDLHGVYSGSAFIEEGIIHYFYTGNVKHLGEHDYIRSGREQNTIYAISRDGGYTIEKQKVVIRAKDYPENMSNHIRDPKVRKKGDTYYMILGARDLESKGQILVYESKNLCDWKYHGIFCGPIEEMGYMWECPDFFELNGQEVLLFSPQGISPNGFEFQNVYQAGYYLGAVKWEEVTFEPTTPFKELDRGFDFYAPQTFRDEQGRQILWGWMGMPDADYTNPTVSAGWQHAMALPRVLSFENNRLYQRPHEAYQKLRGESTLWQGTLKEGEKQLFLGEVSELICKLEEVQTLQLTIKGDTTLSYDRQSKLLTLALNEAGYGRKKRVIEVEALTQLHLFVDRSSLEVFINDGEDVMTTRMYPKIGEDAIEIKGQAKLQTQYWLLDSES